MTKHRFNNSQEERRESTYVGRAEAEADEAGGRYAKLKPSTVVGSSATPQYPRQPEEGPWTADPVPPEPLLGVDVNAGHSDE
jgi:hypothetical protein